MRVSLGARPAGEIGVVALAVHNERRQQPNACTTVFAQHAGRNRIEALRLDRHIAIRAILRPELHEQQPQEMVYFSESADRGFAPAAARALLDGDGGRDSVDRIHVGTRGRLDELSCVGIEGFEIAALAFGKHDVEGERRLARARDSRHDSKPVARYLDIDILEIVLPRVVDPNRVIGDR